MFNLSWTHSIWLWGLLAAPLLFYFLLTQLQVVRKSIPSIHLWFDSSTKEHQEPKPLRFRDILSALCFTLTFCFLLIALAGPQFQTSSTRSLDRIHFFLDLSASMNAVGKRGRTRFDRAINRIKRLADQASDTARWKITTIGPPWKTTSGSPADMVKFCQEISPSQLAIDLNKQLDPSTATNTRKTQNNLSKLEEDQWMSVVLTDQYRVHDKYPRHPRKINKTRKRLSSFTQFHWIPIGTSRRNYGIVNAHSQRDEETVQIILETIYFGPEKETATLELFIGDKQPDQARRIQMEPNRLHPVNMTFPAEKVQRKDVVQVRITGKKTDHFQIDNRVWLTPKQAYPISVRSAGHLPEHFRRWLRSENIRITPSENQKSNPDFIITKQRKSQQDRKKKVPSVVIPDLDSSPEQTEPDQNVQDIWAENHRLTRNVSMENIRVQNVPVFKRKFVDKKYIIPLIQTDRGPLVVLDARTPEQVLFSFYPFQQENNSGSNWSFHPNNPSFVVFWRNVISFYSPWRISMNQPLVYWKTGEIPVKGNRTNNRNPEIRRHAQFVGFDRVSLANGTIPFPRNLMSRYESDLRAPDFSNDWQTVQKREVTTVTKNSYVELSIWIGLGCLLAGIMVMKERY